MVRGLLSLALVLTACRPEDPVVEPTATADAGTDVSSTTTGDDTAVTDDDCVSPVEPEVVAERYQTGIAKLEESRDGDHFRTGPFEEAMGALVFAAENGNLEAQSLYGRTMFSVLFMGQAPSPEQQDDYVKAIMFLRIAALAGDELAVGYLPGLTSDSPQIEEPPLSELPGGWAVTAYARADEWIACHGLPKPQP